VPKRTNRIAQKTPIFGPRDETGPRASIWKNEKELLGGGGGGDEARGTGARSAAQQFVLLGAEGDEDHQQSAHQFVLLGAEGDEGGGSSDSILVEAY
jgi:hypothetical protein